MKYILETPLSENKSVKYGLISIYGIGTHLSELLCKQLGFSSNLKIRNLTRDQIDNLTELINSKNLLITTDLKKQKSLNFKALISIKAYKGLRKIQGFPARGQRTHTNAKISKINNKKF